MSITLTNSLIEHPETVISDKTDLLDNNKFLCAIFGESSDAIHPLLVSFKGDPTKVSKSKWYARPWAGDNSVLTAPENNNYFSLSTFRPNETGEYRRKKANFCGLHAVMLDDVGT